jgi:hypothetical protein
MACDVSAHEFLVGPFALLVAADKPAAISRVGLDDPELRMMGGDVLIGVGRPLLVRAADVIDPQLRQNIRRVVQRLRKIFHATPDEHMQRPGIVAAGAFDDPF